MELSTPTEASAKITLRPSLPRGPLIMLGAALLFTVMSTTVKILPPRYTIWHIGFIRCFGGFLVLILLFGLKKNPFKGEKKRLLILRGITGSTAFVCVITGMKILPLSTSVVLFYAYPVFAAFFGVLFYKDKISLFQMGCMGTLLAGVGILFDFSFTGSTLGQAMIILGAVFAGITVTLVQGLRAHNGPVVIFLYFCTMGSIITAPMALSHPIIPTTPLEWGLILAIILASVGGQLLMNQGFYFCKGFEGAAYMSTETVFAALTGILFLGDPITLRFFAGGLIIVGSGLALNWYSTRKSTKSH